MAAPFPPKQAQPPRHYLKGADGSSSGIPGGIGNPVDTGHDRAPSMKDGEWRRWVGDHGGSESWPTSRRFDNTGS